MPKVINLVESCIGKAGTSLFASFLVDFLADPKYKQCDPILVDLDKINPDVATRYRSICTTEDRISLNPVDNKRSSSIEYLLGLAYENDTEVVVNVPSGSIDKIQNFVGESYFPPVILRRWFVSNLDPKSWDIFERISESFEDTFELILVHNLIDGIEMTQAQQEYCDDGEIRVIKMSSLQLPAKDFEIMGQRSDLPLSKILPLLGEQGQRRLEVHTERIFQWIFSIVIGT
jgi:hypothetical protein